MGIVNVTPDSFSDGGNWFDTDNAVAHALELAEQGADILDFGAQSTRPGYTEISPEEEWSRLENVITRVREKTNLPISVDTYFPYVASKVLCAGADIINDVSGVITYEMAQIVKNTGAGWILMHNGSGAVGDVKAFFENSIAKCREFGIDDKQICLDMGIGFGKDYDENMALLTHVSDYKIEGYPMLLGTSRKRVIAQGSNQPEPTERVYGNISADTVAILGGADIIRIHDVKNEKQGILMAQNLKKYI
jgi:dihydropteroate synthase